MHAAVRSRLNIGIAMAGAGAIALAPIAQPMPAIAELQARAVSSAEVALSAAANPIEQWAEIIQTTLANGGALAQSYLNNPLPILHQLLNNGLGYGQQTVTALQSSFTSLVEQLRFDNPYGFPVAVRQGLDQILAGQIYAGVSTLLDAGLGLIIGPVLPLLDLLQIPVTMAQNFANVVAALPTAVLGVGLGALGTLNGTIQATAFQAQAVFDALRTGDLVGVIGAIVATPGAIVNAVLNGFALTGAPGLLSPYGLVDQVIQALNNIANAIAPTTPMALSAKVADTGPADLPSAALSVATATLGAEKVATTTEATKAAETETTAAEPAVTEPTATEPASTTTEPAAAEPAATKPETPSTATETKPETKPESGSTAGTNGATDTTDGNKAEPGKTGEPTKPSGSTGSETGSGSTTGSESTGTASTGSGSTSSGSGSDASGGGASGSSASGSGASGSGASGAAA
jgi:uncharacterized membrane protein YgcG